MSTPLRILLLSSRESDKDQIHSELCRAGFAPELVRVESEQAYRREVDRTFQLVLADCDSPHFDILLALSSLRELDLEIPLIGITHRASEDRVAECMRQGATDCLSLDHLALLGPAVARALADKRLRDHKRWSIQAVQNSEKRLRALIENSSDGIMLLNADGTLVYASPAVAKILSSPVDELVGCDLERWLHPDEAATLTPFITGTGQPPAATAAIEFRLKRMDGTWCCVDGVFTNLLQDSSVHATVLNIRDVTERKQADQALRESEARFRELFENASDMLCTFDLAGNLTSLNRTAELVSGYNREQASHMTILEIAAPEYSDEILRMIDLGIRAVEPAPIKEIDILTRDNRRVPVEFQVRTVCRDGVATGFQGIARDITERRRMEHERERAAQQMAALLDTALDISLQTDLAGLLPIVARRAADLLGTRVGLLLLTQPDNDVLELVAGHRLPERCLGMVLSKGEGPFGRVATLGEALVSTDPLGWPDRSGTSDPPYACVLGVPLCARGRVIGVLGVMDDVRTAPFRTEDIRLASLLADQAAVAIDNVRLLAATRRGATEFAALYQGSMDLAVQHDLPELLRAIMQSAATLLNAPGSALYLYEPESNELVLQQVSELSLPVGTRMRLGEGHAGRVALSRQPMIIADYATSPDRALRFGDFAITSAIQVPILLDGELLGVLSVHHTQPGRAFTTADSRLLSLFAMQVASAVHNARLFQETKQRAEQMALLFDAGLTINRTLDPDVSIRFLLATAGRAVRADRADFFRYDPVRRTVSPSSHGYATLGHAAPLPATPFSVDDDGSQIGRVMASGEPLYLSNAVTDPHNEYLDPAMRSVLWLSVVREDKSHGLLAVASARSDAFGPADRRLVGLFANQLSAALENTRLFRETRRRAEQLAALNSAALKIQKQLNAQEIYETAADELQHLGQAISVFRVTEQGDWAHIRTTLPGYGDRGDVLARKPGRNPVILPRSALEPVADSLAAGQTVIERDLMPRIIAHLPAEVRPKAEEIWKESGSDAVLLAPLTQGTRPIGLLVGVGGNPDGVDVLAVSFFASHVSTALENARLFDEMQRQKEQLAVVNRIASAVNGTLDLDELVQLVYDQLAAIVRFDAFFIALFDAAHDELDFRIQVDEGVRQARKRRSLAEASFTSLVVNRKQLLMIQDWEKERATLPAPVLFGNMRAPRTWMGVPLLVGDSVVGVISIQSYLPNAFQPEEERLVATIAEQVAVAIEKAWLFEAEQTSRQELAALYDFSRDLTDIHDLDSTLELIARRAVDTIHVSFARIMLCDSNDLVVRAAHPVRVLSCDLRIGQRESLARTPLGNRVMQRNRPMVLSSKSSDLTPEERETWLLDQAQSVCLVPLCLGNRALGLLVLGEMRREEREPFSPKKIRLAHGIADQAASAIHRSILRDKSQRDAAELAQAYEATIEGWSRALDLRDKETEGHTQRVTQVSLQLAQAVGITDDELVHLRRGALLHDIGKMAIPDRILLKPGPLTGAEWEIMRKHPTYAYELLLPIAYLHPALDIPYCHHERWDGSGYPRGLKGQATPLAARVFAIVDVWDALRSDRPYRAAWPDSQVHEYLGALSGVHFDPQIVDAFMRLLRHGLGTESPGGTGTGDVLRSDGH